MLRALEGFNISKELLITPELLLPAPGAGKGSPFGTSESDGGFIVMLGMMSSKFVTIRGSMRSGAFCNCGGNGIFINGGVLEGGTGLTNNPASM